MKNVKILHSGLLFFIALWVALGGASRSICELKASQVYRTSRPGGWNSYEFITMGIEKYMTENEVATLLAHAEWKTDLLKMRYDGKEEKGYSQFFKFTYGPKWSPFFIVHPRNVCHETITVHYDESRHARSVSRYVSGLLVYAATKEVLLK